MTTFKQRLRTILRESVRSVLLTEQPGPSVGAPGDAYDANHWRPSKGGPTTPPTMAKPPGGKTTITTNSGEKVTHVVSDKPLTTSEVYEISNSSPYSDISHEDWNNIVKLASDKDLHEPDTFGGITISARIPLTKLGFKLLDFGQTVAQADFFKSLDAYAKHPANGTVDQNTGEIIPGNTNIVVPAGDEPDDTGITEEREGSPPDPSRPDRGCTWSNRGFSHIWGPWGDVYIEQSNPDNPFLKRINHVTITFFGKDADSTEDAKVISFSVGKDDKSGNNRITDRTVQIQDTGIFVTFSGGGPGTVGKDVQVSKGDEIGSTVFGYVVAGPSGLKESFDFNALSILLGVIPGGGGATPVLDVPGPVDVIPGAGGGGLANAPQDPDGNQSG
jgi:hypothetical protein